MTPTQRARDFCKKQGWIVGKADRWNPYAKVTNDLFGFIDLIVLDGLGGGPLGVQVTSGSNHAARVTKIRAEPRHEAWLRSPARIEVWSFSKKGERGKRKLWELRREVVA